MTVRLVSRQCTVELSKDSLYQVFPNCLLTQTLDLDSSTETIELTQLCITPQILEFVHSILQDQKVPILMPPSQELMAAGRYLLMDLLIVLADAKYPAYAEKFNSNLIISGSPDPESLIYSIHLEYMSLFTYLYSRDISTGVKYRALAVAIIMDNLQIVKYILRDTDLSLDNVRSYGISDLIEMLPLHIDVDEYSAHRDLITPSLHYAMNSPRVFGYILEHTENPMGLNFLLGKVSYMPVICNLILSHPKCWVDPFEYLYNRLIGRGDVKTVQLLIGRPEFNKDLVRKHLAMWMVPNFRHDTVYEYKTAFDAYYQDQSEMIMKIRCLAEVCPSIQSQYESFIAAQTGQSVTNVSDMYTELVLMAIDGGQVKLITKLLQSGANHDELYRWCMLTAYKGNVQIAQLLMDRFYISDPTARARLRGRASELARMMNHTAVATIFEG